MGKNDEIVLYRYPNKPDYIPLDNFDLIEKTKFFLEHSQDKEGIINYAIEKHPRLKDALLSLIEKE